MRAERMLERVVVEYFDQNEEFAQFLPRSGGIIEKLADTEKNPDWLLVELDEPFDYQIADRSRFRLTKVTHFLLRSRWQGMPIGSEHPVSVFILAVEEKQLPVKSPVKISEYIHGAWGMCHTLRGA